MNIVELGREMGYRCCTKQKVKRGLWSPEEDEKLATFITSHGHSSWSSVPKLAGLERCGKSCRLRWINYLRPDLRRGSFTEEEEVTIIEVHRILGNRWAQIAKHLPGRTDNEVKNFWNSCIKKKLLARGLDPNTHNLLPPPKPKTNASKTSKSPRMKMKLKKKKKQPRVDHDHSSPQVFTVNTIRPHKKDSHAPHKPEPSTSLKASAAFGWGNDGQTSVGQGSIPVWADPGFHVEEQEMISIGDMEVQTLKRLQMEGQSFEHLPPFRNNGGSAFDFRFEEYDAIIQSGMYGDVLNSMNQLVWDIAN